MSSTAVQKKGSHKKPKKSTGEIIFQLILYIIFGLFMVMCIFPFYYLFINTISENDLVNRGLIFLYPRGIHFQNYINVFKLEGLRDAAKISVLRTVIGTALGVYGSAYTAYLVSKQKMWKRKIWYRFIVVGMYVNAGIIAWYINMMNLGLLNNFWAYILPGIIAPMNVIMIKTYIEQSVPLELEEAAEIDGAGILKRFFLVVLPLCGPILATMTIFTSIGHWNSLQDTLLLMSDRKLYTLQFVLHQYENESMMFNNMIANGGGAANLMDDPSNYLSPATLRMTISMVVVFPILLVYPFFQRYFIKGIMIGAIKG